MKRLFIHADDRSTDFLKPIYANLDATVVTGGKTKFELMTMIEAHDQVMMMGHGTPRGLLGSGQFPGSFTIIDDTYADVLSKKDNTVFIWCHADQYVERNGLRGFCTGNFISEPLEAELIGLRSNRSDEIDESNHAFVDTVSRFVDRGARLMHAATRHEYGRLAEHNPIAAYNHKRLYAYSL